MQGLVFLMGAYNNASYPNPGSTKFLAQNNMENYRNAMSHRQASAPAFAVSEVPHGLNLSLQKYKTLATPGLLCNPPRRMQGITSAGKADKIFFFFFFLVLKQVDPLAELLSLWRVAGY